MTAHASCNRQIWQKANYTARKHKIQTYDQFHISNDIYMERDYVHIIFNRLIDYKWHLAKHDSLHQSILEQ